MHGLAWRGLRARPLRTTLTTIGVTLGVAVLYAGLATNAGIGAAVDRAVGTLVGSAELRVATFGETGLSDASLEQIKATPGIAVAAPAFERRTYLGVGEFGPGPLPPPVTLVGIDAERERRIHDLTLATGAPLTAGDATGALVSASLAREDGISVGTRLGIQGMDEPLYLRVAGVLAADGPWGGPSGRVVVTDLSVAQSVFAAEGVTRVDLDLEAGTDPGSVIDALQGTLLSEPYTISSPRDLAASMEASTGDFAAMTALIAAIALFAGAFLIFNTLSMTVVERVRELGLLRAAGATRRQLTGYILVQASVIGVLGSALGVVVGGALAAGIAAWLGALGDVPVGAPVVRPVDAMAASGVGLGVTLAAAVEPARRAGRVAPVEALKARLELPSTRRARLRWLVGVFVAVGVLGLMIWPRAAGEGALVRALAVYGMLLAVALLVPLLLPSLARIAGLPFAVLARLEERLARASVLRDRARAALTVGALTIGLALIVALGGVGQHARATAGAWVADVVPGDLVVTSIFPRALDEGIVETLGVLPGVRAVSPFASFDLAIDGRRLDGAAMVGDDLASDGRLHLVAGDRDQALAALDAGGSVIVPAGVAQTQSMTIGSILRATAADGSPLDLSVAGIAERTLPGRAGESILVGWSDAERLGVAGADAFGVRFASPASAVDQATLAEEARSLALDPVPLDRIQGAIGEALDRVFSLFDALSLVAVIVASLGIVNTLTMNVLERVREIGVLRAAGMTRTQVWRSVVVEAGITGLAGAICGVASGILVGGSMVVVSGGRLDPGAAVPWLAVGLAVVLGVALAMLAAAYPARLASGVSIVRAVSYE
ncbi:MAG TPA: FtsX-like permease family protein [Candidatus Limnocylindrales bacterium]|nr:FtsX-like permease family protein [Candidatus Limnocylindrales bacterium]